jgi:hypothetical protein
MTNIIPGTERVRPSSLYYLLSLAFVAAGIGLGFYFPHADVPRIREDMARMNVPGDLDLDLKQREIYTAYVEHATWSKGAPISPAELQPLGQVHCDIHTAIGDAIEGKHSVSTSRYTYGHNAGVSILDFEVPRDGTYTVSCQGPSEVSGEKIQVAVGGGSAKALTAVTGRSIVSIVGGLVIAILVLVRVTMLRLESRRDIRERGLRPI